MHGHENILRLKKVVQRVCAWVPEYSFEGNSLMYALKFEVKYWN